MNEPAQIEYGDNVHGCGVWEGYMSLLRRWEGAEYDKGKPELNNYAVAMAGSEQARKTAVDSLWREAIRDATEAIEGRELSIAELAVRGELIVPNINPKMAMSFKWHGTVLLTGMLEGEEYIIRANTNYPRR